MSGFYVLDKKIWNFASGDASTDSVENCPEVDSRMVSGKRWKVVKKQDRHYLVRPNSTFSPRVTPDEGE